MLAHTSKINILATNPDSLYLAISSRYASSPSILTEIADADIFVIDEFHAYHGASLANLMYALKMIDCIGREKKRFIFLSATPPANLSDVIQNMFGNVTCIRLSDLFSKDQRKGKGLNYEESPTPRIISYDVNLSLFPLALLDDFASISDLVSREVNRFKAKHDSDVHCVLILNSVLDAVSISRVLQDSGLQVSQIHGLIPKSLRKISGDVVVGTSAIELGIDFQAHSVIFEGNDSASFLQRFGRVGRHFEGNAIGFVPSHVFTNRTESSTFSRESFETYISNMLTNSENYAGFIRSSYGMDLLSAIIRMVHHKLDEIKEEVSLIREAKDAILRIGFLVQQSTGYANANLGSRMYKRVVKSIALKPSARGSSYSIIVFLSPYNAAINIDITDAYKKLDGLEEIDHNSVSNLIYSSSSSVADNETKALLLYGLHSGIPIMRSSGITATKKQVELAISDQHHYDVRVADEDKPISLVVDGQPMVRSQNILIDVPYSVFLYYPDWRFNPIPIHESKNNYGVIGVNSLVCNWSKQRNSY